VAEEPTPHIAPEKSPGPFVLKERKWVEKNCENWWINLN
jgi:hypothetical protein